MLCFVNTHKFCVSYEAKYHQHNSNMQKDLLKTVLGDVDHLGDWRRRRRWAGLEVCVDCLWSSGIAEAEVLYSYVVKVQVEIWKRRLPAVIPGRLRIPSSFLRFLLDVINPKTIDQKTSRLYLWLVKYCIRRPGTEYWVLIMDIWKKFNLMDKIQGRCQQWAVSKFSYCVHMCS